MPGFATPARGGLALGVRGDEAVEQPLVSEPQRRRSHTSSDDWAAATGPPSTPARSSTSSRWEKRWPNVKRSSLPGSRSRAGDSTSTRRPAAPLRRADGHGPIRGDDERQRLDLTILPAGHGHGIEGAVGPGEGHARADRGVAGAGTRQLVQQPHRILARVREQHRDVLARSQAGMQRLVARPAARDERQDLAPQRLLDEHTKSFRGAHPGRQGHVMLWAHAVRPRPAAGRRQRPRQPRAHGGHDCRDARAGRRRASARSTPAPTSTCRTTTATTRCCCAARTATSTSCARCCAAIPISARPTATAAWR